jgi:hypothetical protein
MWEVTPRDCGAFAYTAPTMHTTTTHERRAHMGCLRGEPERTLCPVQCRHISSNIRRFLIWCTVDLYWIYTSPC